jgi:alkylation response protein AidB-like acyl-CoA dehydrogenase
MRFVLDGEQRALLEAVTTLLDRSAGPERMRALGGIEPAYDHELDRELHASGFTTAFLGPDTGPLEAALVVEAVARKLGVISAGATCLVMAAIMGEAPTGGVALTTAGAKGLTRYAADAETIVIVGADEVRVVRPKGGPIERVRSAYGYPMGRLGDETGELLTGVLPERVRSWWRVALAVELAGTMSAALELTLGYVRDRQQFGRPIGTFQALQHRLAECTVLAEGSRWLALEAAWNDAPTEQSAAALAHAIVAGRRVVAETHQFTGAMGFTTEYDLHLWSMRIPALIMEAEGISSPGQAVSAARWALNTA